MPFAAGAKYWQKFQAALSDVATTSIRGSQQHHLIDLEVLAVKISVVGSAAPLRGLAALCMKSFAVHFIPVIAPRKLSWK